MTRSGQLRLLLVALAALVGIGACGGKDSSPGTPAPCFSGALLHVLLSPTVASMTAPTFSICRNDTCYPWAPAALPASGAGGPPTESITNQAQILGTLWRYTDGTVTLDVEWRTSDASQLADGDHYEITLADGTDTPVVVLDKTAIYTPTTSSGLDSGAACLEAKLSA